MSKTTSHWRLRARRVIEQTLAALPPDATLQDQKRALGEAYPFGERAHHPYRQWCLEVRRALKLEKPKDTEPASVAIVAVPAWSPGTRPPTPLWLQVRCGWCGSGADPTAEALGGCMLCLQHREYLLGLLRVETFRSLLAAVRAGRTPAGVLADWCEENGHDGVSAALRAVGVPCATA